jgi:predicted permease
MAPTAPLLPALLPDFTLILLGAALRRILHLGDHFWTGVEKLVYFVLFPALLFNGLARTRIDWSAAGPLLLTTGSALAAGMLLGHGLRVFQMPPRQFASHYQCAFRFNSYIGLAVIGGLHGNAGVAAMAIVVGVMVPPANIAAVWMLARHGEQSLLRELARNPLILATLSGLAFNLCGLTLPETGQRLFGRLADGAVVLGLLAVGAGLRWGKVGTGDTAISHPVAPTAYLLTVKLLILPAIAFLLARTLALPPIYADAALIFAGLPVASSAFILAQRMGGDGPGVAWIISASTLLGMLSLAGWLSLR